MSDCVFGAMNSMIHVTSHGNEQQGTTYRNNREHFCHAGRARRSLTFVDTYCALLSVVAGGHKERDCGQTSARMLVLTRGGVGF
jgi:hypothetical protein